MSGLNRSRQLDIFRPEQALSPVTVIGAGGIGSPTVMLLAQMGVPDITVLDFDTVEEHNRASQLYPRADVGKAKVASLAETIDRYADCRITVRQERYVDQPLSGLVISAVDNMEARQAIWEQLRWNPNVELYVDGRMGGQVFLVLTARPYDPDDVALYEKQLFPDSEAAEIPCTARSIAYNTFGIASEIASVVRMWWIERRAPRSIRKDFTSLNYLTFW
jgi:hypothetical protein